MLFVTSTSTISFTGIKPQPTTTLQPCCWYLIGNTTHTHVFNIKEPGLKTPDIRVYPISIYLWPSIHSYDKSCQYPEGSRIFTIVRGDQTISSLMFSGKQAVLQRTLCSEDSSCDRIYKYSGQPAVPCPSWQLQSDPDLTRFFDPAKLSELIVPPGS